ncbi:MAG: hypothetical protein AAGB34_11570, partial [Planctomycetota bacterium]
MRAVATQYDILYFGQARGGALMKRLCVLFLGLFLILGACGNDTHSSGGEETQTLDGVRIVVLSPAFSQTLVHLGYRDVIVGRHGWDQVLGDEVPVIGDQLGIEVERLSKLNATTVVVERTVGGTADELKKLSDRMGFEVVEIPSLALDEVVGSFAALDRLARGVTQDTPLSSRAQETIRRWNEVLGNSDGTTGFPLGRTLSIVTVNSGIGVTGPGSFSAEIVERIGGEAIPSEGLPYQTLTVE